VQLIDAFGAVQSVKTGPDGIYSFDGLAPGEYRVAVQGHSGIEKAGIQVGLGAKQYVGLEISNS
jgi:hypothetical protein